ncbi:LysR substrate-binding domain-containing protein [Xanthobacter sp. V2C-8]|uniref:LysR substrate-binding domain-containing protein n=1 Tax=Xanthobacter albus TaxID=3119929 RepID=UPI00372C8809
MNLVAPKLKTLRSEYPDVIVELSIEDGLTDIVSAGFDAGIRNGEQLEQDMIAVRIGPDLRSTVVAAPIYFERRPPPSTPEDLKAHSCIGYRKITAGELYRWEFEKSGRALRVAVTVDVITNDMDLMIRAALDGLGLAYMTEDQVAEHVASGALVPVLQDWCVPFAGSFLYYPSGRQLAPAMRVIIDALRHNPGRGGVAGGR